MLDPNRGIDYGDWWILTRYSVPLLLQKCRRLDGVTMFKAAWLKRKTGAARGAVAGSAVKAWVVVMWRR